MARRLLFPTFMKSRSLFSAAFALSVLGALPASGALSLLYSTTFSSPTYSDGGLIGQDGWAITGTATNNPVLVANASTNGNVPLVTTGQDVNRPLGSAGSAGSTFLVSATINLSATQATGDYFMHLGDGGTSNLIGRVYARSATGGFQLAYLSSSGTPAAGAWGTTVLSLATSYNILFRYDYVAGAINDTGSLWVNPTANDLLGGGDAPYVGLTISGTDPTGSLSTINLRQGATASAPTLTIDNVSVSGDLIPEPSVMLLGALGVLGILRRRR